MQSVQPDLHKYFKTQKNSQQFGKSKQAVTKSTLLNEDRLSSSQENKIIKNISHSLLKSRAVSSKAVSDASQRILDFSLASSFRKYEPSNVVTKKRKQQQVDDLNDNNIAPIFKESKLKYENKNNSAIKRLRLDLKIDNAEQILDKGKKNISEKLKSEDVKKRISKCSHASELQTRVQRCLSWVNKNSCEDNALSAVPETLKKTPLKSVGLKGSNNLCSPHKTSSYPPKLEFFKSIDLEVPVSPSKSPLKLESPLKKLSSPVKTSQRARFGLLAEYSSGSEADQLVFPKNFQNIQEDFRAADTVVSLRHNRQEMTIFSKFKRDVCEMIRRTFSEVNLGRLKTVFPLAYIFKQEKVLSKESDSYNVASYQLTIEPNFIYKKAFSANLLQKFDSATVSGHVTAKFCKMDWNILLERRNIFNNSLLEFLRKRHEKFLKKLDPPISLTGPVSRWHEDFLSSEIELPEPSPLPQSPEDSTPKTAQQVMEQGRNLFSVNNRMKAALDAVAASKTLASSKIILSPAVKEPVSSHLKGLPSSLLEKIRAREREKTVRDMCRSSKENRELEMLSRLPQLASNIWSIFISVKKATIIWEEMVSYVGSCDKNDIPQNEIPEHLKLLLNILGKEVPGWCVLINIRGEQRLKLVEKERKVSDITEILNKVVKQKS